LSARFLRDRCKEKNPAAARQDKNQGMSLREHGRPETIKLWLRAQVNLKIFFELQQIRKACSLRLAALRNFIAATEVRKLPD
jgi:hypothetical protein